MATVVDPLTLTSGSRDVNGIYQPWMMKTGETLEQQFTEPADSAATTASSPLICGPKTYTVTNQDGTAQNIISVVTLTANSLHKLVAYTDSELEEKTHDLVLTVHLGNTAYPT